VHEPRAGGAEPARRGHPLGRLLTRRAAVRTPDRDDALGAEAVQGGGLPGGAAAHPRGGAAEAEHAALDGRGAAVDRREPGPGADLARQDAQNGRRKALAADAENRGTLARQYVANGARLREQGTRPDALLWFVEALRKDAAHDDRVAMHRRRIAAVAQLCPR